MEKKKELKYIRHKISAVNTLVNAYISQEVAVLHR